ncbi:hypothetical protein UYSO10_5054 [Kosakonia radicincitans]|nr:hypothetical protein UYSO10_5054 [Kosakonia radicincitans]
MTQSRVSYSRKFFMCQRKLMPEFSESGIDCDVENPGVCAK